MFNALRNLFARKADVPAMVDDTPDHKGFSVTVAYKYGTVETFVFATLKEAQCCIMRRQRIAREVQVQTGWAATARRYGIRNLETGKFAAYKWQLTAADIA